MTEPLLFDPEFRNQHKNSNLAWEEIIESLNGRREEIFDEIKRHGPGTDREIMGRLGYKEPNSVRPRITELLNLELIEEIYSIICEVTGKKVRVVDIIKR